MSVYVDTLMNVANNPGVPACFRKSGKSCHMYADNLDELHDMAKRIGLKREWYQVHPVVNHYDLTPLRREVAVQKGAIEQGRDAAMAKWKEIRANGPQY